ncbi:calcium/proton exchanger [Coccidioides immitis RS]|uniref:Vacuolar calcium ion transporter n=1 Tax=Coccidioides immitis (strain RS) TaxID=246410 RepID=A0A0D8JUU9_COCIM|nr:calcium/proton exchanger [Coccidioides immitis RS]KJF61082.1 calcium/proton exchanger [Coccidioides immitis RS]
MARANFQSQFRRHGSFFSSTFWSALFLMPTYHEPDPAPGNGSIGPNEHTGLLNGHDSSPPPSVFNKLMWYRSDRRVWVRLPSEAFYLSYATLVSNYVNILLVLVPLGMASGAAGWNPTATFILNFFAIIPLASLLSFATEELAATLGETLGGLLNATFGNAVELIVSIIALQKNEIRIVQASMLGSILSNILLVLGCCFFIGGIKHHEQTFNSTVASTMSSLMAVASASLIIPATLYAALAGSKSDPLGNILILSHGTAIILLIVYIMYLYFQLKSHSDLFESRSGAALESQDHQVEETNGNPQILNPWAAGVLLLVVTVAVAICAEFLVGTIDNIVESANISRTFIGLILIPIVGNAAEHVTAIVVAYKNKMDLAIGVAIGSSLQIALFVTPFLVILGWIFNRDMTLHFQTFETVAFFVSGLVVTLLIQDGKSNYLEGGLCLGMYVIIALAFYVYPDDAKDIPSWFKTFASPA